MQPKLREKKKKTQNEKSTSLNFIQTLVLITKCKAITQKLQYNAFTTILEKNSPHSDLHLS